MSHESDWRQPSTFSEAAQEERHTPVEELKAAQPSGDHAKVSMNRQWDWHRHTPPLCAGAFCHPSCKGFGPDAGCSYLGQDGMCDCAHWRL
jgi:hypothetical protein